MPKFKGRRPNIDYLDSANVLIVYEGEGSRTIYGESLYLD